MTAAETMESPHAIQPDSELLARSRERDEAAFTALVRRHEGLLINYLTRLTGSRAQAEDLAQETFVRFYQQLDRYREQGNLTAYLIRIGTNLVRSDERRKRRWLRLRPRLVATEAIRSPTGGTNPGTEVLALESQREVTRAIAALDLPYRSVLVLREIEGLPYRAIAQALECSEGTVKSRLFRARELLKARLTPYWTGGSSS